jgi:dihydrofolate reductase
MNEIPKFVASRTLTPDDLTWPNSHAVARPGRDRRDLRDWRAVRRTGRVIKVMGSASLAAQLIEHDLVDEYRLMIEPILLGGGKRIFPDGGRARTLELVSTTTTKTGVLNCTNRRR